MRALNCCGSLPSLTFQLHSAHFGDALDFWEGRRSREAIGGYLIEAEAIGGAGRMVRGLGSVRVPAFFVGVRFVMVTETKLLHQTLQAVLRVSFGLPGPLNWPAFVPRPPRFKHIVPFLRGSSIVRLDRVANDAFDHVQILEDIMAFAGGEHGDVFEGASRDMVIWVLRGAHRVARGA